jgi:hypothetical protein
MRSRMDFGEKQPETVATWVHGGILYSTNVLTCYDRMVETSTCATGQVQHGDIFRLW